MPNLPFDFCPITLEVRSAMDERRIPDAKRIAAEHLRSGRHSKPFLNIVAELLELKKQSGKRGRKHITFPHYWYEIGNDFEQLRDDGDDYRKLAKKYGPKVRTIEKTVAFFRKAKKEHDEIR